MNPLTFLSARPGDLLTYQLQKGLTGNEVKALIPMTRDAATDGTLWSSYTRLARMAGLSRSQWFTARKSLVAKGCIRRLPPNNHQLTGFDDGWVIDKSAWERPENRDSRIPKPGTGTVPKTGTGNPSSSEPWLEPKRVTKTTKAKAVETGTVGVTNRGFPKGFEEEGVTARNGKGLELRGTQTVIEAEPPKQCAPPPAAADPEEVAAWMERHYPNHREEPSATPFALRMLRDYRADWWAAPIGNRADGWHSYMTPEMVAARYVASADSWRKFREDLIDKLVRGGLPAEIAGGALAREPVHCHRCGADTGNYATSTVMRRMDGSIEVDQCGVCVPGVPA